MSKKTPMQEHIEWLKGERNKLQGLNERIMVLTFDHVIAKAESILEKEKEVINKAYEMGSRDYPMHLKEDYYNETFKTKEK